MTRLEKAGQLSSIGTAFLAVVGLWVAVLQIRASEQTQREASARDSYKEYLKLAMEKPEFAEARLGKSTTSTKASYAWFVEYFLYSAEQIYQSFPNDKEWNFALSEQICYHRAYLKSPEYIQIRKSQYAPEFSAFIDKALDTCKGK